MINGITPNTETLRLLRSQAHQGYVVAHQIEAGDLKIRAPGDVVEISEEARRALELAKQKEASKTVKPVDSTAKSDTYHPYRK